MGIAQAASLTGISYSFWWQVDVAEAAEVVAVEVVDIAK
jgi:hypothetical protein